MVSGMVWDVVSSARTPSLRGVLGNWCGRGIPRCQGLRREAEGVGLSGCRQRGSGWHDSSQDVLEGDSQRQWSLCMSSLETQTPLGEVAGTVCVLGISRGPSGETKKKSPGGQLPRCLSPSMEVFSAQLDKTSTDPT